MSMSNPSDFEAAIVGEIVDYPLTGLSASAQDVEDQVVAICGSPTGADWRRDQQINFGAVRWRPSAVSDDGQRLLYVLLQDEFPSFVERRLRLAADSNVFTVVALKLPSLYRSDVLELLVAVEADVIVLDDFDVSMRLRPRSILATLADIEVPVAPDVRRSIGNTIRSRLTIGTSQVRGRRLEALLAFVFAQVRDFRVVEHNYRNETEEIDLILQVDNYSQRSWQKSGVPFILVEAKNRADKASQQMMSVVLTKLQTKRGSARIAFMVSLAGFTKDAELQELRFSTQDICVVMIDGEMLGELVDSEDLDESLEKIVRRALLR